jgi:hypothetical protein
MANAGFITREEAERAQRLPLRVEFSEPPVPDQPFWSDWVARLLINEELAQALGTQTDALRAMGDTAEERRRRVFQTGCASRRRSTRACRPSPRSRCASPRERGRRSREEIALAPSAAIISIEPSTGAIRALAVGPQEFGSCLEDGQWAGELEDGRLLCDKTKVNPRSPAAAGRAGSPDPRSSRSCPPRRSRPASRRLHARRARPGRHHRLRRHRRRGVHRPQRRRRRHPRHVRRDGPLVERLPRAAHLGRRSAARRGDGAPARRARPRP